MSLQDIEDMFSSSPYNFPALSTVGRTLNTSPLARPRGVVAQRVSTEVRWRVVYTIISFRRAAIVAWNESVTILRVACLKSWSELWAGKAMSYSSAASLWESEILLSIYVALVAVYPLIGGHIVMFMANRAFEHELRSAVWRWIKGWLLLWGTRWLRVQGNLVSILINLDHADDDEFDVGEGMLVYVPVLRNYRSSWMTLRIMSGVLSQIPLLCGYIGYVRSTRWINYISNRDDKLSVPRERFGFIVSYALITVGSILMLGNEILALLLSLVLLGISYQMIMLASVWVAVVTHHAATLVPTPTMGGALNGRVTEWSIVSDCRSDSAKVRLFESGLSQSAVTGEVTNAILKGDYVS